MWVQFHVEAKWKTGLPTLTQAPSLLFPEGDRFLTCTHVHVFNGNENAFGSCQGRLKETKISQKPNLITRQRLYVPHS